DGGFWIAYVAQGWLVLKLTNSPFWLGIVAGSGQVPYAIFALLGGSLADRFDRRRLVAGGNALLAVLSYGTALLVASDRITIALLALLAFAAGTIIALEHPVDRAWLYDLVNGEQLGRAIALSSLEWSVARTLGPALGGVAIASFGVAAGYAAYGFALIPLVAFALALTLPRASGGARREPTAAVQREDAPQGVILPFSLLIATFTIGISPYIALLPDIAKNGLHLGASGYGLLSACGGAGAMAGALALIWLGESRRKGRIVTLAMFAGALLLIAFTQTRDVRVAAALAFAMGAVDTCMYALANTYVQECTRDDRRGRANGIFTLAFLGGIPVGNLALGVLAGRVGSDAALAASAATCCLACAVFWFAAPRAREAG
ncbi:MAG: MFS transporter, partial [Vulcanimicrobiaceae bacterium]